MGSEGSAKGCVFCGERKLSGEHLWPEWLQKLLPDDASMDFVHSLDGVNRPEATSFSARPFRMEVNAVCEGCNNTWMSNIENEAKIYAAEIIQGRRRRLSREGQLAIARWAVLKAMMFECADPGGPSIPPSHFTHLYEQKSLPPDTWVWIARYDPTHATPAELKKRLGFYSSAGLAVSEGPRKPEPGGDGTAYVATFSVNYLALKIFGHAPLPSGRITLRHPSHLARGIRQIWPINEDPLLCPSGPTFTVDGLQALATVPMEWGSAARPPHA